MLTGTLITAAGFLPIGMAKLDDGGIHLCHLCRDGDCAGAELDRVGVLRALPGHAAAEDAAACGGGQQAGQAHDEPHEMFDSPFYNAFRAW
jgi:hypothetical protein